MPEPLNLAAVEARLKVAYLGGGAHLDIQALLAHCRALRAALRDKEALIERARLMLDSASLQYYVTEDKKLCQFCHVEQDSTDEPPRHRVDCPYDLWWKDHVTQGERAAAVLAQAVDPNG